MKCVSLALALIALVTSGCDPAEVADSSADLRRCNEMAPESLDIEVVNSITDGDPDMQDAMAEFVRSPAYRANPDAWNWSFCLGAYGWVCDGGSGAGTLSPTPPTECRSQGRASQIHADNPHV